MNTENAAILGLSDSATALDQDFGQIERLSLELERLDIESESGLKRAKLLLQRFSESSERIGTGIQALAQALEQSRERAEKAAEKVSTKAAEVQAKQQSVDQMLGRFQALGEMVKKISAAIVQLQSAPAADLTATDRAQITQSLPELDSKLEILIEEAARLKGDAKVASMKNLESDADALNQSLQAVRKKLSSAVAHLGAYS